MKKVIILSILFTLCISVSFSYYSTPQNNNRLNSIYSKIDLICEKSKNSCTILKIKIDELLNKNKQNKNIYGLLVNISKYTEEKINKNIILKEEVNKIIVTKVVDGDTIHFKKEGKKYVTRLIGIDSPENTITRYGYVEKLGNEAKIYLNNLILNKEITIEYDKSQTKIDKYGRHLIYIFYDGKNINQKMIEQGLAKEYTYNKPYKYQKDFKEAEIKAKKGKKGIWSLKKNEENNVLNHINNHNTIINSTCNIKGNINSKGEKIYHYPGCKSYKKTKISIKKGEKYFCSEEEAKNAGWRMALNCN